MVEQENKRFLKDSIDALFYSILSEFIDRYEQVLTAVELSLTDLGEKTLSALTKKTINHLDRLSRQFDCFSKTFLARPGCYKLPEVY